MPAFVTALERIRFFIFILSYPGIYCFLTFIDFTVLANSDMVTMYSFLSDQTKLFTVLIVGFCSYFIARFIQNRRRQLRNHERAALLRSRLQSDKQRLKEKLQVKSSDSKDITRLKFDELWNQLQTRKLKPSEVLTAYQCKAISSTEKTNSIVGFVPTAETLASKLDASESTRPLHGIPVSVKDCFIITGTESTAGHAPYIGEFINDPTSNIVQFLEWAGCIPFVKTNVPQAMLTFDSENPVFGITLNPHNILRGPGGSSSGEGSLIGDGGSILGVGNDVGGSLRIPVWLLYSFYNFYYL